MIKALRSVDSVKNAIASVKGEDVTVKVNLGRNKFVAFDGKLTCVYPFLFTVSPYGEFKGKTSFSYAELMCGNVKIKPKRLKRATDK
jgi:uncharacterized protein Veg